MQKYVDVSGVGNAGKGAIVDLMREMENFDVPHYSFEFDIFRVPGGILDFKYHLCEDWSPIRSHDAYRKFIKSIELMGLNPKWYNFFQFMNVMGNRYDSKFESRFTVEGKKFAASFLRGQYMAFWPYEFLSYGFWQRFYKKFLLKSGLGHQAKIEVLLVEPSDFDNKATQFINSLFSKPEQIDKKIVVFNNAFEAFNPIRSLNILKNSKSIIVVRDPRDVYVSGQSAQTLKKEDRNLQAKENDGLSKSFLATDDLQVFVERYRLYAKHVYDGNDPRVLVLRFEEVVTNYESTVTRLLNFLELDTRSHINPKKHFDPAKSIKNIGKWKQFSDQESINIIASELKDYLWEK